MFLLGRRPFFQNLSLRSGSVPTPGPGVPARGRLDVAGGRWSRALRQSGTPWCGLRVRVSEAVSTGFDNAEAHDWSRCASVAGHGGAETACKVLPRCRGADCPGRGGRREAARPGGEHDEAGDRRCRTGKVNTSRSMLHASGGPARKPFSPSSRVESDGPDHPCGSEAGGLRRCSLVRSERKRGGCPRLMLVRVLRRHPEGL